jgi:2'-5' RNA ligase
MSGGFTDRLFFAVYPDADTAERITEFSRQFARDNGLTGRLIAPERLHVTLAFLGDHAGLPDDLISGAKRAAERIDMRPFAAVFDQVANFHGQRRDPPLVLLGDEENGLKGLVRLHQRLAEALVLERVRLPERSFKPHVTLVYDQQRVDHQFMDPVGWKVGGFRLVQSLIGRTRHIPLGDWTLSGDDF